MKKIFQWMKNEAISVIPAVIYFTIVFNLIYYTSGLTLPPNTVRYYSQPMVTIGGLIIGKIIILANAMPFINAFPHKPLAYSIGWKFIIYNIFVVTFLILESAYHLIRRFKETDTVIYHLRSEFLSPIFISSLIWFMLTFLCFIIFTEFFRAVGKDRVIKIFLG